MLNKFSINADNIRVFPETEAHINDSFSEDRMRIVSSNAFKRLEAKTQVFPSYHGDHYRKRLTHSLEVGGIAKNIAKNLGLNADLSEIIALSHDLGHPPFGHTGEDILSHIMESFGGKYDHNTFSFKLVTKLEKHRVDYDGLNLTIQTLDGILKHNGPCKNPGEYLEKYNSSLPAELRFDLAARGGLEAQIAAISDDIAYINHDIEDGIRADLLHIEDVKKLPIFGEYIKEVEGKYSFLQYGIMARDCRNFSINQMQNDVCAQTVKNIEKYGIQTRDDVPKCPAQLVYFSEEMHNNVEKIRSFLFANLYRNKKVEKIRSKAKGVIETIFHNIVKTPEIMPDLWVMELESFHTDLEKKQVICDYIAGMTDTFAVSTAKKITAQSRII